jgi:hypothetical protein
MKAVERAVLSIVMRSAAIADERRLSLLRTT